MSKSYKGLMNQITTFIFDVDGVLTDGTIHVTPTGEMLRNMNIRDGYAMKAAVENGYTVCIISGGSNEGVRVRLRNLGITDIHLGVPNKVETFRVFTDIYNIQPENVLYMGDDIPDYHVMQLVGLPTCPQNFGTVLPSLKMDVVSIPKCCFLSAANICPFHASSGKSFATD